MSLQLVDWDVPVANDQGICGFIVMRWPLGVKAKPVHNPEKVTGVEPDGEVTNVPL